MKKNSYSHDEDTYEHLKCKIYNMEKTVEVYQISFLYENIQNNYSGFEITFSGH